MTCPPEANRKTKTTSMFSPIRNRAVSTIESGTASRGNWILRTIGSRSTRLWTDWLVDSERNTNSTSPDSSATG